MALVRKLSISQANLDQLEVGETNNLPECIYKVLIFWLARESVTLSELKSIFCVTNIKTNVSLPFDPNLYNTPCDTNCMLELKETISTQWKFFGRYLGLPREKLDEVFYRAQSDSLHEVVYLMLQEWRSRYGNSASLGALLKAIYRVWTLSPIDGAHAWDVARKLAEI